MQIESLLNTTDYGLERAFRISKSSLERTIHEKKINLSVGKVLDAAKTITTIRVKLPENGEFYTKTLFLTDKHRQIQPLFESSDGEN